MNILLNDVGYRCLEQLGPGVYISKKICILRLDVTKSMYLNVEFNELILRFPYFENK